MTDLSHVRLSAECKDCSRQFVRDPQNKIISAASQRLIDKWLLERQRLAGIA
ncbi:MAG: hypothetical protein AAF892_01995 [Cyanobacteria bacterium P01_D01_bin.71]